MITTQAPRPTGQLQIIICYGHFLSNHVALRLVASDNKVVFWDPGGTYGDNNPAAGRKRDLVLTQPPTLEQWWLYRSEGCNEPFMAVFEWDLDLARAKDLQNTLMTGVNHQYPGQIFYTDAPGLFCSIALTEFLVRFGSPEININHKRFLPHKLADDLWAQSPSRVLLFYKGKSMQLFMKNTDTKIAKSHAPTHAPSALTRTLIR